MLFRQLFKAISCGMLMSMRTGCKAEDKAKPSSAMTTLTLCHPSLLKEEQVNTFELTRNDKPFRILAVRRGEKVHCLYSECPHEIGSSLGDSICLGNKLCCLDHGCSFNIENGHVETGPSLLDLAVFPTVVTSSEVKVMLPQNPPRYLEPAFSRRDHNYFQKVLVVGGGMGAAGCIRGLRWLGYQGEITLVCDQNNLPYSKDAIYRSIEKSAPVVMSRAWLDQHDVTYLPFTEVFKITNKHGSPFVTCDNGASLEYDALVLATGSFFNPNPQMINIQSRIVFLDSKKGHEALRQALPSARNVTVMGISPNTLQLLTTLLKERPDLKITCMDEAHDSTGLYTFGPTLLASLMKQYRQRGVKFILKPVIEDTRLETEKAVIVMGNGQLKSDLVIALPQFRITKLKDFQQTSKKLRLDLEDSTDLLNLDVQGRAGHKRIFGAGDCANVMYFGSGNRVAVQGDTMEYETGFTSACNIMALSVPFHYMPIKYIDLPKGRLLSAGSKGNNQLTDRSAVYGSMDSMDFIKLDFCQASMRTVQASRSKARELRLVVEAVRLGMGETLYELGESNIDFLELERRVRATKRVGCFKDEILRISDQPLLQDVIWLPRTAANMGHRIGESNNSDDSKLK